MKVMVLHLLLLFSLPLLAYKSLAVPHLEVCDFYDCGNGHSLEWLASKSANVTYVLRASKSADVTHILVSWEVCHLHWRDLMRF